jgi:hypothetical protein
MSPFIVRVVMGSGEVERMRWVSVVVLTGMDILLSSGSASAPSAGV